MPLTTDPDDDEDRPEPFIREDGPRQMALWLTDPVTGDQSLFGPIRGRKQANRIVKTLRELGATAEIEAVPMERYGVSLLAITRPVVSSSPARRGAGR